jgi:hypothetical protein
MPVEFLDEREEAPASSAAAAGNAAANPIFNLNRSSDSQTNIVLNGVITALLVVVVFALAVNYTFNWDAARRILQSLEYEGHVLWACVQIANGKNIYDVASLSTAPWAVTIYNPLYFVVGGALLKVFGVSYMPLRVLSILSFIAGCLGMHCILRRCKVSEMHSLVAIAFFASYVPTMYWSCLARVDMLGLALGIWGLERFTAKWPEAVRARSVTLLWSSIVLFLLSFFTKQSGIYFPVAAVAFAFFQRERALGLRFLASVLIPLSLVALTIDLVGGGYLAHLTYAASLPWEWDAFWPMICEFLYDPKTIAAMAIITIARAISGKEKFDSLALILLAITVPTMFYTMGVRAAYHNHLLPVFVGLTWLLALSLRKLPAASTLAVLVSILLGCSSWFGYFDNFGRRCVMAINTDLSLEVVKFLNGSKRNVLAEDPALAIFAGLEPEIIDATTIFNMRRNDKSTIDKIINDVKHHRYSMITINSQDCDEFKERIWPASVVFAVKRYYQPVYFDIAGNGNTQRVYIPVTCSWWSSEDTSIFE